MLHLFIFFSTLNNFCPCFYKISLFREDRARKRLMEEVSEAWNKQIQVL